jgi:hypothetical protein
MKYAAPISNSLIVEKQLLAVITVSDKQCDALHGGRTRGESPESVAGGSLVDCDCRVKKTCCSFVPPELGTVSETGSHSDF